MGIGNALSTLFTSVVRKPEQAASLPNVRPAADLPTSQNPLAGGFPQWIDPVTAELDRNAYIYIRRTHATAYPIEKLGRMLAAREVQVVSNNADFAEIIQTRCIDKIAGISEAIRWLTWALVEGVSFVYLDGRYVSDWYVPRMVGGGRRKERAGGVMLWDGGDNIVSKQQLVGAGIYPESASDPASYPRHEWMVWRPGGGSNPEGDTDLAYRLYRLAQMAQDAEKQRSLYLERYGTPFAVIKSQLEGLGEDEATQALSAAARKAAMLKRGVTMSLSSDEALSFVNPDGSAWMLLVEATREIEKAAHQEVLLNATTSAPQSVGPDQRGSGDVHKSEEELAVEAAALSMADTALYDLQRNIETNNAERLREAARETSSNKHLIRIPEWHLVLAPSKAERDIDKARTLDLYAAGVPVKAIDLYAAFGAEVPEGTEAVLKKEQPSPFGGFGGFGNDRAQLSANITPEQIADDAAAEPDAPIAAPESEPSEALQVSPDPTPEPLKDPAPEPVRLEERSLLEELDEGLADEVRDELNKAFFAIAEQVERGKASPKLPESTLMMLAKTNMLAEMAGRAEAQAEIEAHHGKPDAYMALAERAAERVSFSASTHRISLASDSDDGVWRTLDNGTKVKIGDDGVIEAGPPNTQGKTLEEAFSDPDKTFGRKGGDSESKPEASSAPAVERSGSLLDATKSFVRRGAAGGDLKPTYDAAISEFREADSFTDAMRTGVAAIAAKSASAGRLGRGIEGAVDEREVLDGIAAQAQKARKADLLAALNEMGEGAGLSKSMTKGDLVKRARSIASNAIMSAGTYIELSADDSERVNLAEVWRTIGAKNGKGGTPVQIDEETGEIVKGPDQLKGKDADNPKPGASRAGGSDESEAYDYFQDLENELAGDVENGMDVSERLEAISNDARDMIPGLPDAEARAFARDLGIDAQGLGRDELDGELLDAMNERLRDAAGISESRSTFSRALEAVNIAGFDLATGAIDLAGKALGGAAKLAWRAISSDGVWAVVTDTPLIAAPFRIAEIGRRIFMRIFATEGTYEETLPKWFGLVAEDEDRAPIFNASRSERVHLANQAESAGEAFRLAQDSLEVADVPSEWARLVAPIAVLEMGRTQRALTADSLRALTAEVILEAEGEIPEEPDQFVREFVAGRDGDGDGPDATPIGQASRAASEEGE